jgi:type IV pilus assembly protein PilN
MDVIQKLQGNRHQIVHMFDEIVNTAPGDLYYESLIQNGDMLTLSGVAKSNALVSEVMNNIDASPWFQKPELKIIQKRLSRFYQTGEENRKVSEFRFTVKQDSPKKANENEENI